MKNYWPARDNDATPIGSTKDDETGRLLVEATQAGDVNVTADKPLLSDVVCLLNEILIEQKITNMYLANINGETIKQDEVEG